MHLGFPFSCILISKQTGRHTEPEPYLSRKLYSFSMEYGEGNPERAFCVASVFGADLSWLQSDLLLDLRNSPALLLL
jgi:hypothetical protein